MVELTTRQRAAILEGDDPSNLLLEVLEPSDRDEVLAFSRFLAGPGQLGHRATDRSRLAGVGALRARLLLRLRRPGRRAHAPAARLRPGARHRMDVPVVRRPRGLEARRVFTTSIVPLPDDLADFLKGAASMAAAERAEEIERRILEGEDRIEVPSFNGEHRIVYIAPRWWSHPIRWARIARARRRHRRR